MIQGSELVSKLQEVQIHPLYSPGIACGALDKALKEY